MSDELHQNHTVGLGEDDPLVCFYGRPCRSVRLSWSIGTVRFATRSVLSASMSSDKWTLDDSIWWCTVYLKQMCPPALGGLLHNNAKRPLPNPGPYYIRSSMGNPRRPSTLFLLSNMYSDSPPPLRPRSLCPRPTSRRPAPRSG